MLNVNSPEVVSWLAGAQKITEDYFAVNFPNNSRWTLVLQEGPKFLKVCRQEAGEVSSVHAFIDRSSGDVLKPASWARPAKHARGNVFDAQNGLGSMGPYGPAYLR